MKFSTSAPLSVISLLGAIANAAPVPEPEGAMLAAREGDKPAAGPENGVKAPGPTPSAGSNGMRLNDAPTITHKAHKAGETKLATPGSLSSNSGGETILVCHRQKKQKHGLTDKKVDDKEQKPQDKSPEHKRAEPQSPKPDSSEHDSSKHDSSKHDPSKHDSLKPDPEEDKEEIVLVCHEKEDGKGHKTEQNKPTHDFKPMEADSQGQGKTEDDKKLDAGAKPQNKVPTKTAQ
jgi:hypothetical protein